MASRSSAARAALFPPGVVAFLRRRLIDLCGLALAVATVWLIVALAGFEPSDPSLNTATAGEAHNPAGLLGAYAADLVLQALGLAATPLLIAPLAWAWGLIARGGVSHPGWRIALLPAAAVAFAAAFAALPQPAGWPIAGGLGGALGAVVFAPLAAPLAAAGIAPSWFAAPALALALFTLSGALGLDPEEWRALGQGMARLAGFGRSGLARAYAGAADAVARAPKAPKDKTPRKRARAGPGSGRKANARARRRIEPHLSRLDPDRDEAPPARSASKAKIVARRPARSRGRQEALDLVNSGEYQLPPLGLLTLPPDRSESAKDNAEALTQNARLLEAVLDDFGVRGEIVKVRPGPVVTLYELEPAPGTKSARVISLADDIARSMSAISVRVALIPGRSVIGIELPNSRRETVYLRELLSADEYEATAARLALALGKDIGGAAIMADLARMPHLLVAGTTGSGKSVAINSMILSLAYRLPPDQCKFILIDPKMLELSVYDGIPHLLAPVVTDAGRAVVALKWAVREMESRYRAMSRLGVRNIIGYNKRLAEARAKGEPLLRRVQTGFDAETGEPLFEEQELPTDPLPYIVIVVDEMADLMLVAGKDVEGAIQRLAQMARAAGIHLIMATQRPSVDVITGTIKANFPTRISFQVTSKIDSRTILGEQGAEQLLGEGDMLFMSAGGRITRVHGPFVSDAEVERVAAFLKTQGRPDYVEAVTEDDEDQPLAALGGSSGEDVLYDQAVALVCRERKASTSFVQRHLQIGYNRAARIIERMEVEGVISRADHVGRREVLARDIDDDRMD